MSYTETSSTSKTTSTSTTHGPKPMFSLTHSETVQSIKWRPKRKSQVTACSSQYDAHLYVWDFKRPYVPYLSFDFLTNKVKSEQLVLYFWIWLWIYFWLIFCRKDFMWRNTPNHLIASTKQMLYNVHISDASKPKENSVTVQIDKYGSLAYSIGVEGFLLVQS